MNQTIPPEWYKEAVIYEVHVRAFFDSDGDGVGDFKGLTQKLDYLQDLGVTALWLLPFYPSPLRDDGYDIADYYAINPTYGDMRDFRTLLEEAHRRGLKVITELVLNHTSDQHPWFQRARRAPKGSRWRKFYVWTDDPGRYSETRIIFKDFEPSNWSWDPVAGQYYWHRFYHHQPDLNFDNPEVRRALFKVLDYWFGMGVDGLRLDAVPYLYERDGTNNENLPETHGYLRDLRSHVEQKFPGRMLLAEANQWPDDSIAYFGSGDECHMAFHFPLMPRLFMSVRMEDRFPIIEILEQTPPIPSSCQWALFLRNHDELTLEMVTDEERDYMYRAYAADPQARINLGIRRRLAPLLGSNRRKIELLNGLLFSFPGTPIIYYGDEIGMGDNVYLGDRNGVRTPMQWSGDRNAGFSRANPQKLYFPVIIDPEYHYETVNVETESGNLHSLLWWMKRLIALRKRYPVFGLGSIQFLFPQNRKVLAFLRRSGDEVVLVVANLSRYVQPVSLDLLEFRGAKLVELFGQTAFPVISEAPYFMTLGPHSFYWFSVEPRRHDSALTIARREYRPPEIEFEEDWEGVFESRTREKVESALLKWLPTRRWFISKGRTIQRIRVADAAPLFSSEREWRIIFARVEFAEGEPEVYQIPLGVRSHPASPDRDDSDALLILNRPSRSGMKSSAIYDSASDPRFAKCLLDAIRRRKQFVGGEGSIEGRPSRAGGLDEAAGGQGWEPRQLKAEQSNTSIAFGEKAILKLFRRIEWGPNPEAEVSAYLTDSRSFTHSPKLLGSVEYQSKGKPAAILGVLLEYCSNEGDAARYTIDQAAGFFETVLTQQGVASPEADLRSAFDLIGVETPLSVRETIGSYLDSARILGRRTAELHLALGAEKEEPAFAPEPFGELYQRSLSHGLLAAVNATFENLRENLKTLPEAIRGSVGEVLEREGEIQAIYASLREKRIEAMRLRTHGDYHLGQLLCKGNDFIIIDFEGEPMKSIGERRIKRSPLKDVAGMLRSFHYAWEIALRQLRPPTLPSGAEALSKAREWGRYWEKWISASFLTDYLGIARPGGFLPVDGDQLEILLKSLLLERAIYEISYELNSRTDWLDIPINGLLEILKSDR